ncbi:MAG: FGGY family carbohydrate kinase [Caldilineaceae bacterium]
MLAALDLAPDLLPPLHPSDAIGGALTSEAATALGLRPGIPVAVGAADTAAALGAGAVEPGAAAHPQHRRPVDPARGHAGHRCPRPHPHFCSVDTRPGTGLVPDGRDLDRGDALRWLRDNVLGFTGDDAYAA